MRSRPAMVLLVAASLAIASSRVTAAEPAKAPETRLASAPVPVARTMLGETAAETDTTVEGFLKGLSDSTDAYFGMTAAPLDTAGLDSARAWGLAHPRRERRGSLRPSLRPYLSFNRIDGPVYGGTMDIGQPRRLGRLTTHLAWAAGPNDLLGYGQLAKVVRRGETTWESRLRIGRETANLDRDRSDVNLAALRAFLTGNDRRNYLRHDGAELTLNRTGTAVHVALGYRDHLETPRATTTTWTLFGDEPTRIENLPAARGRAREFSYEASWRVPRTPVAVAAGYQTSSRAIDSDFEYRRLLLAAGADIGLGRFLSLVPQFSYGSLTGDAIPQGSFYLGGPRTLRSVPTQSIGGTRMALARVDLIGISDLLQLARVPHPDAFPIQGALFAGVGAVWGPDPFGGPRRRGGDWPHVEEWKPEAGFSLLYQPGIPEPTGFLRLSFAWALGPDREEDRISISYARAFDLLRPFDR